MAIRDRDVPITLSLLGRLSNGQGTPMAGRLCPWGRAWAQVDRARWRANRCALPWA